MSDEKKDNKMTAKEVTEILTCSGSYNAYIPEYTHNGLWRRIDLLRIDTKRRRVIGFEIKVSRSDFKADKKWQEYSKFCTTLSIACPSGLISKDEVPEPYGLVWIGDRTLTTNYCVRRVKWIKRPKDLPHDDWKETYTQILENELVRLCGIR